MIKKSLIISHTNSFHWIYTHVYISNGLVPELSDSTVFEVKKCLE